MCAYQHLFFRASRLQYANTHIHLAYIQSMIAMSLNMPAGLNNVPAALPAGSNVPTVNVQGPTVVAQPVASITIANSMFSALSNDSKFSPLSLAKDNWLKWKQKLLQVLGMSDLDDYIFGTVNQPDTMADPSSTRNWSKNHMKTVSCLSMHVEDLELPCLTGVLDANVAWNKLLAHHEKQGPITQV
jgi:hypothetical protein